MSRGKRGVGEKKQVREAAFSLHMTGRGNAGHILEPKGERSSGTLRGGKGGRPKTHPPPCLVAAWSSVPAWSRPCWSLPVRAGGWVTAAFVARQPVLSAHTKTLEQEPVIITIQTVPLRTIVIDQEPCLVFHAE